jgi:DNA-directed RNA polymerase subunit H (RpoH/RPB5)
MDIITKITNSRNTLKEVLSNEYDTSNIPVYTNKEIEELYKLEPTKDNPYTQLGNGIACNFSVNHKYLNDHKLHVIYYNFPQIGKSSSKVTKTISDKIISLYTNNTFSPTDNVIVIINESISDTIQNIINSLNINFQYMDLDLSKFKDSFYKKKHFRNVFIFDIKNIQVNILNHELVPKHEIIRDENEIEKILLKCNCNSSQLPIISKNDPVSKLFMCTQGDIFRIIRTSKTCGNYYYYRICR